MFIRCRLQVVFLWWMRWIREKIMNENIVLWICHMYDVYVSRSLNLHQHESSCDFFYSITRVNLIFDIFVDQRKSLNGDFHKRIVKYVENFFPLNEFLNLHKLNSCSLLFILDIVRNRNENSNELRLCSITAPNVQLFSVGF